MNNGYKSLEELDESLEKGSISCGSGLNRMRIVRKWQLDHLVGQVLTLIEMLGLPTNQEKSTKDTVRNSIYKWWIDYCLLESFDEERVNQIVSEALVKLDIK